MKFHRTWLGLAAIGLAFTTAWFGTFASADRRLQDFFSTSAHRAVSEDVVIIAIDDKSLAQLGRWPWSRAVHAALLERLAAQQPRAIGVDLFLTESTSEWEDGLLAEVVAQTPNLILPVLLVREQDSGGVIVEPVPVLAGAAHGLAHVHIQVDADGMVRSVPSSISIGTRTWRQLALEMLDAPVSPGLASVEAGSRIPFAGQAGMVTRYSYIDVLKDALPPDTFRGKWVLVGVVSAGLGDTYVTPATGYATLMPGVEIIANYLDAQLQGVTLAPLSPGANAAVAAIIMALAMLAFAAGGGATVWRVLALSVGVLIAGWCLAWLGGLLLSPAAALFMLWAYFLVWNALRMRAVATYFLREVRRLTAVPSRFASIQPNAKWNWLHGDVLDRGMFSMSDATEQLGKIHAFVESTLDGLPDPLYVTDANHVVKIANIRALEAFAGDGRKPIGVKIQSLLAELVPAHENQQHLDYMLSSMEESPPTEMMDARQRSWLVSVKPHFFYGASPDGWLVSLSNLSALRQAERAKEEVLQFVSHDIRSPQASIIALIDTHYLDGGGEMPLQVVKKIEQYALNGLEISNAFVQLSRAQTVECRNDEFTIAQLLASSIDEVLPRAKGANVEIHCDTSGAHAISIHGDLVLLRRAIINLLTNAIKFSPPGGCVTCGAIQINEVCRIEVQDQGPGVPPEQEERLFKSFSTLNVGTGAQATAVGLGLRMVQTVAERHNGRAGILQKLGKVGACFYIDLPCGSSEVLHRTRR